MQPSENNNNNLTAILNLLNEHLKTTEKYNHLHLILEENRIALTCKTVLEAARFSSLFKHLLEETPDAINRAKELITVNFSSDLTYIATALTNWLNRRNTDTSFDTFITEELQLSKARPGTNASLSHSPISTEILELITRADAMGFQLKPEDIQINAIDSVLTIGGMSEKVVTQLYQLSTKTSNNLTIKNLGTSIQFTGNVQTAMNVFISAAEEYNDVPTPEDNLNYEQVIQAMENARSNLENLASLLGNATIPQWQRVKYMTSSALLREHNNRIKKRKAALKIEMINSGLTDEQIKQKEELALVNYHARENREPTNSKNIIWDQKITAQNITPPSNFSYTQPPAADSEIMLTDLQKIIENHSVPMTSGAGQNLHKMLSKVSSNRISYTVFLQLLSTGDGQTRVNKATIQNETGPVNDAIRAIITKFREASTITHYPKQPSITSQSIIRQQTTSNTSNYVSGSHSQGLFPGKEKSSFYGQLNNALNKTLVLGLGTDPQTTFSFRGKVRSTSAKLAELIKHQSSDLTYQKFEDEIGAERIKTAYKEEGSDPAARKHSNPTIRCINDQFAQNGVEKAISNQQRNQRRPG